MQAFPMKLVSKESGKACHTVFVTSENYVTLTVCQASLFSDSTCVFYGNNSILLFDQTILNRKSLEFVRLKKKIQGAN